MMCSNRWKDEPRASSEFVLGEDMNLELTDEEKEDSEYEILNISAIELSDAGVHTDDHTTDDHTTEATPLCSNAEAIPFSSIHLQANPHDSDSTTYFIPGKTLEVRITKFEKTEHHMLNPHLYTIELTHGIFKWTIRRRYKHFRVLHDQLNLFRAALHIRIPTRKQVEPTSSPTSSPTSATTRRMKRSALEKYKRTLPRFPRRPEVLLNDDEIEARKNQLATYLNRILQVPPLRNHHETLKFLEVGQLSFVNDLGVKSREGLIQKRSGGRSIVGCCSCCSHFVEGLTAHYNKRYLVLKDTFIAYVNPDTGMICDVLLMDSHFTLTIGVLHTGMKGGMHITTLNRHLQLNTWTERGAEEWAKAIQNVADTLGKEFTRTNRYDSYAPLRHFGHAQWFVDGAEYMAAVADALESAKEEIFITDWWLSPEIYMKRPMIEGDRWRLDVILKRKAHAGVKIFIILYKEVEMALGINSFYSKSALMKLHPTNIRVLRHPDVVKSGVVFWSHHEKIVTIDQRIAFLGGIDLCYGRYDSQEHRLNDMGSMGAQPSDKYKTIGTLQQNVLNMLTDLGDQLTTPEIYTPTYFPESVSRVPSMVPSDTLDKPVISPKRRSPSPSPSRSRVRSKAERQHINRSASPSKHRPKGKSHSEKSGSRCKSRTRSGGSSPSNCRKNKRIQSDKGVSGKDNNHSNTGSSSSSSCSDVALPNLQNVKIPGDKNISRQISSVSALGKAPNPQNNPKINAPPNDGYNRQQSSKRANPASWAKIQSLVHWYKGKGGSKDEDSDEEEIQVEDEKKARARIWFSHQNKGADGAYEEMPEGKKSTDFKDIFRKKQKYSVDVSKDAALPLDYTFHKQRSFVGLKEDEGSRGSSKIWIGKDYVNFISKDFVELDKPFTDFIDRTRMPRMPWHDIGAVVYGKPARDVARHFIHRWNYIKIKKRKKKVAYTLLLPKSYTKVTVPRGVLSSSIPCKVQVLRSSCAWSVGLSITEHSIHNAYVDLIDKAEHFIYIENQFFISIIDDLVVENKIAEHLYKRIVKAHRAGKTFRVFVTLPLLPAFEGELGTTTGGAIQIVQHWNYASICRGRKSLLQRLGAVIPDPSEYICFCGLRTHGVIDNNLVTELVYVHSKMMVVDDRFAIIGSANINDRSLLGSRDSEIAIVTEDTHRKNAYMNGKPYEVGWFASGLRQSLFREHLGVSLDDRSVDVSDPVSKSFYHGKWKAQAALNTQIYEAVFRCIPTDSATTFTDMQEFQSGPKLAETDRAEAEKMLKQVKGYLVEYPTKFLKNVRLEPSVNTKEGLMPDITWV